MTTKRSSLFAALALCLPAAAFVASPASAATSLHKPVHHHAVHKAVAHKPVHHKSIHKASVHRTVHKKKHVVG